MLLNNEFTLGDANACVNFSVSNDFVFLKLEISVDLCLKLWLYIKMTIPYTPWYLSHDFAIVFCQKNKKLHTKQILCIKIK